MSEIPSHVLTELLCPYCANNLSVILTPTFESAAANDSANPPVLVALVLDLATPPPLEVEVEPDRATAWSKCLP